MVKPWAKKISPIIKHMTMTPIDFYNSYLNKGLIQSDAEQLKVLHRLQKIYEELKIEHKKRFGWCRFLHKNHSIKGLYVWGGVGIGKTFMMDCFYDALPFKQKMRMHFHMFMQRIHDELKKHQGEMDPLQVIASEIANQTLVICFDEFYVSDIADAMLLGRLFKALFSKGVCLVATSNIAPDDLYKDGLQRLQFLPAIALIKANTETMHITSQMDYRLRHLKEAGVFYSPLGPTTAEKMQKAFDLLTLNYKVETSPITINGRLVKIKKQAHDVIWFDFKDICSIPRSQHDYLEIANLYKTVLVSDIPVIPENESDTIRLFVNLIDVLYDARVKLVISAAESVPLLYSRGHMILEYARTHSRLVEMQSQEYFFGDLS